MDHDDLEPIDLEPIDLEPVDPRRAHNVDRFDRDRPGARRVPRSWFAVIGVGLAAWAAIALTTRGAHDRAVPPTPSPTSTPLPAVPVHVDRITSLAPHLWTGLQHLGSGRFAAVVDDRLYLLDRASTEAQTTLVPLPEGHVTIDDQSGASLLASTYHQTLVSTMPARVRTLAVTETAIRAAEPDGWWLLSSDGTIRREGGGDREREPAGTRVAAAVGAGFVAIDPPHSRWVLWSGTKVEQLAPGGYQLVGNAGSRVVFRFGCSIYSCSIEIDDLARHTTVRGFLTGVPQFAAFSPDGTRLAIASTLGDVWILDTATGGALATTRGRTTASPSMPFTWTPDGRSLLVVGDDTLEIRRATDGHLTGEITGTAGLQQLVALP